MKSLTIKIDTLNDAFEPSPELELARVFSKLGDAFRLIHSTGGDIPEVIHDINGNTVGTVTIKY